MRISLIPHSSHTAQQMLLSVEFSSCSHRYGYSNPILQTPVYLLHISHLAASCKEKKKEEKTKSSVKFSQTTNKKQTARRKAQFGTRAAVARKSRALSSHILMYGCISALQVPFL